MNVSELFKEIIGLVQGKGWNPIVGNIRTKEQQWYNWYRGDVNGFHTFNMKINGKTERFERQTMNIPKKICEDYHSLIWNDKCQIKIEDEKALKIVNDVLEDNSFYIEFGAMIEMGMAVGMSYMVEYLDENLKTKIDFITFENAIPLQFDNSKVTALLTISYMQSETKYITHLTYHYMDDAGIYNIKHEVFVSKNQNTLGAIISPKSPIWEIVFGAKKYVIESKFKVSKPFFQIFRPNIKNHFDQNSPYGISIYATMLGYFMIADTMFDAFQTDTNNNKTRIIMDSQMLKVKAITNEETGEVQYINYIDEQDTALMAVPMQSQETGQKAIEYFAGNYQHDQLEIGLNAIMKYCGWRAGLGKNYYSFTDGNVYQNETNVISTNADTYKNKKKHEIIAGRVIKDLVISILELENIAGRYSGKIDRDSIEVIFDDSIVIDDEAIENKYKILADENLIPKYMYVAKVLKINEDEAKKLVAEGEAEQVAINAKLAEQYQNG